MKSANMVVIFLGLRFQVGIWHETDHATLQ